MASGALYGWLTLLSTAMSLSLSAVSWAPEGPLGPVLIAREMSSPTAVKEHYPANRCLSLAPAPLPPPHCMVFSGLCPALLPSAEWESHGEGSSAFSLLPRTPNPLLTHSTLTASPVMPAREEEGHQELLAGPE